VTVTDNQQSRDSTHSEEEESVFFLRVAGIMHQEGVLVCEHCRAFLEGHAMIALVESILSLIPHNPQIAHINNVLTLYLHVKSSLAGQQLIRLRRLYPVVAAAA